MTKRSANASRATPKRRKASKSPETPPARNRLDRNTEAKHPDALRSILRGTFGTTGNEFFRSLVRHIALAFEIRFVLVGEITGSQGATIKTVAFWSGDHLTENKEYALKGTPCENVVGREPCCYPRHVAEMFPQDDMLKQIQVECYLGIPLFDSNGKPLGLLSVMDDRPLDNESEVLSVLEVFAPRAGAELERLRTEAAYQESQRALTTLMSNLPGMAYRCRNDPDWTMEFVSQGCQELTGHTSAELLNDGKITYAKLIHPDDRQAVWDDVQSALNERNPFQLVYRILTASGGEKWVWEQGRGVFSPEGQVIALEGFVTDITERKRADGDLVESRKMLQLVLDAIPVGVFWKDRESVYLGCNRRLASDAGLESPEEIVGKNDLELSWVEQAEMYRRDDREVMQSGIPKINYEEPRTSSDGTTSWIRISKIPLRNLRGEIIGVLGCYEDITERKQAEARADSERRFSQSLIETAPTFIVGIDREGRTVFMNRAMAKATGYKLEDVIGRDYASTFLPAEERTRVKAVFEKLLTGTNATHSENHVLTRGGERLLVAWHGNAIFDTDGNVTAFYGIGEDITERRVLEEQLRHSQKMESIGTLTGGIAHDFNNLLTVILGNVSFLLTKLEDNSPLRRSLEDVEKAGTRAGSLIHQMLAFGRKTLLQIKSTDPQQCIDETIALLRRSIDPKIQIRVRSQPGLWRVRADPNQINHVIMNLCLNARDAMRNGGFLTTEAKNRTLTKTDCRLDKQSRPGEFVELVISDTGSGMNAETQRRIFEPFFTTKEVGMGTGLGLAMVYGIVSQHEGWITVRSRPGKGTTFRVFLPRDLIGAQAEEPSRPDVMPKGSETVLIVDDETLVVQMVRRVLTDCGYRVMSASDGTEAVKLYRKHRARIDLVILDITLPKMHGFEVLDSIRRANPDARVILCTGQGTHAKELDREGWAADLPLIRKPLTAETLAVEVRRALDE